MPTRDLVVVGASAGGVEALRELVRELPGDLAATVLVVLHLPASAFSALPQILDRAGPLPARSAEDGAAVQPGAVLVAPPDRHLLVRDGRIVLGRGPKENGHRPAIDALFRTAARWYGPRVIGIVLSGTLDDGAAGLRAVVERGGTALVQDPRTAVYPSMPEAALRAVPDAESAEVGELAALVAKLCADALPDDSPSMVDRVLQMETDMAEMDELALAEPDRPGRPAAMSCPDCHGAMFEIEDGPVLRFRCRVGHAWSPDTLLAQQRESTEAALWMAIRTLEEKAALHRRLGDRVGSSGPSQRYHAERAQEADQSAALIREMLRLTTGQLAEAGTAERETG
jgi:two-component system chemotaxis response regulator CheB